MTKEFPVIKGMGGFRGGVEGIVATPYFCDIFYCF